MTINVILFEVNYSFEVLYRLTKRVGNWNINHKFEYIAKRL